MSKREAIDIWRPCPKGTCVVGPPEYLYGEDGREGRYRVCVKCWGWIEDNEEALRERTGGLDNRHAEG